MTQTTFDADGPDWSQSRRVECPQAGCDEWIFKRRLHAHIGSEDCAASATDATDPAEVRAR